MAWKRGYSHTLLPWGGGGGGGGDAQHHIAVMIETTLCSEGMQVIVVGLSLSDLRTVEILEVIACIGLSDTSALWWL